MEQSKNSCPESKEVCIPGYLQLVAWILPSIGEPEMENMRL